MTAPRLVLVGGGRMGEALLGGLLAAGWAQPSEVAVVEKDQARADRLAERWPGLAVGPDLITGGGVVVAVKPGDVEGVCRALAGHPPARVLSIAAGLPLARLEGWLGGEIAVVRAMPNTPSLVGAGAAAIAGGRYATESDLAWSEEVLGAVGTVVRVTEPLLEAVTGVSGSGPAYVFLVAEAMTDAGVLNGLSRDVSAALTVQTLLGASRMLAETGEGPEALRAAVTSPGGTTAAALRVLEAAGVRAAFLDAVSAAAGRAREMAEE